MIWEELQDTEVLEDLCNGIYLARMKGQLEREYALYYLLVRIYRSPELLYKVSRPKVPLEGDDEDGLGIGARSTLDSPADPRPSSSSPPPLAGLAHRRRTVAREPPSSQTRAP